MSNGKIKAISIKLPESVYNELKKIADEESVGTIEEYGLKTTVSGVVRAMILKNIRPK